MLPVILSLAFFLPGSLVSLNVIFSSITENLLSIIVPCWSSYHEIDSPEKQIPRIAF